MKTGFIAAAGAAFAALLTLTTPAWASGNHEGGHGPAGTDPSIGSSGPKRLPDGSVFLPKPAQRQMRVRTFVGEAKLRIKAGSSMRDLNALTIHFLHFGNIAS